MKMAISIVWVCWPVCAEAAASVASEERGAIHDEGDPRATLFRILHVGQHV